MNYSPEELATLKKDLQTKDAGILGAFVGSMLLKLIEDLEYKEILHAQEEAIAAQWRTAYYQEVRWALVWKEGARRYREGYRQACRTLEEVDYQPPPLPEL